VIVENTFTSVPDMVDVLMPFLRPLRPWLLKIKWASIDIVHRLDVPMLFISGLKDELVPPIMMKRLHDASKAARAESERDAVEIFTVPGGGHGDTQRVAGEAYIARVRDFIARHLRRRLGAAAAETRALSGAEREAEERARRELAAARIAARRTGGGKSTASAAAPARAPAAAPSAGPAVAPPEDVVPPLLGGRVHLDGASSAGLAPGAEELAEEEREEAEERAAKGEEGKLQEAAVGPEGPAAAELRRRR
jgi:hypothetical protein